MARLNASNSLSIHSLFLIISSLLLASHHFLAIEAQAEPPVVNGLSFSFFAQTCPKLETIVRKHISKVLKKDNGQAPGLLRIFFHDCFVTVSKLSKQSVTMRENNSFEEKEKKYV